MSYTDETVYTLREAIYEYSQLAMEVRELNYEVDSLKKEILNAGIPLPVIDEATGTGCDKDCTDFNNLIEKCRTDYSLKKKELELLKKKQEVYKNIWQ